MRRPPHPTAERLLRAAPFGALVCQLWGCAPAPEWPEAEAAPGAQTAASDPKLVGLTGTLRATEQGLQRFSTFTYSPDPAAPSWVLRGCDSNDLRLSALAHRVAVRTLTGQPPEPLGEALRQAGVPQIWPRGFTLAFGLEEPVPLHAAEVWLNSVPRTGGWRCGLAVKEGGQPQRRLLSVVAVEVLAELERFPRQVRVGQWSPISARLTQPTLGARVLVAGPNAEVYVVPHTVHGDRLSAQFVAREPGVFQIQIIPDFGAGPRPALEITTFVEVSEPAPVQPRTGPRSPSAAAGAVAELLTELNGARVRARLPPLLLDSALTQLAQAHAEQMARTGALAHDAGDGAPTQRVVAAELGVQWVGENVAQAIDAQRAHSTLWASAAHRANLLHPRFTHVGIGAKPALDGRSVWFCELFADAAGTSPEAATPATY